MVSDICKQGDKAVDGWHRYVRLNCVRGGGPEERREELQTQTQVQVRETTGDSRELMERGVCVFITCPEKTHQTSQCTCKQEKVL